MYLLYTIEYNKTIGIVHKDVLVFCVVLYIVVYASLCYYNYNGLERRVKLMGIKFDKLFVLLERDGKTSTYWLRQNGMHPSVVNKLRKNLRVNTDTIAELCRLLSCQPGDIMEYIPEIV